MYRSYAATRNSESHSGSQINECQSLRWEPYCVAAAKATYKTSAAFHVSNWSM